MITIRIANVNDSEKLEKLSKELGYETTKEQVIKRISALIKKQDHYIFIAEENEVRAFISFEKYETLYFDPGLNITGLVVDSNHRNKGIGKLLIAKAESVAREMGLVYLRANSGIQRIEAHNFYRDLGFDSEKDQKRFIKNLT